MRPSSICPLLRLQRPARPSPAAATHGLLSRYLRRNCSSSTASLPNDTAPDHRTIAATQQLLVTSQYSPGSPLFLPHGARIYNKLVEFLRAQYAVHGFQEVLSPNIYKRALWETSGHWENFKADMFEVTGHGATPVQDEEGGPADGQGQEYGLKPMNCPGHCLMFKATGGARSLRDLPVRYADFSPLHRNENSGSLSGLTRVRRFHQDDGHIFCRPVQIAQEISATLEFIETVYRVFHLPAPELVLSTRPDSFLGDAEVWDRAEAALMQSLDATGRPWTLNPGDGAFYGPKIDVLISDSGGKKHQTATIQLDFQLPRRFGLEYLAPAPESELRGLVSTDPAELSNAGFVAPVLIHRAVMGSLERFMALLMEHYDGRWPFWLSPRQAIIIPVAMTPEIAAYADAAAREISGATRDPSSAQPLGRRTFHVDVDTSSHSLAKKIRAARTARYNYVLVVGERNVEAKTVSVDRAPIPHYVARARGEDALLGEEDENRDEDRDKEGTKKRKKPVVEMAPVEVYQHFVQLEEQYA